MTRRIGVAALVGSLVPAVPALVHADHDMAMSHDHGDASELSIGLSIEAAEFDNGSYVGSYQGMTPQVGWMHGRVGASATLGMYHLTENGLSLYGVGDATASGHATVFAGDNLTTGVALHVMIPTGSELHGFGMGHDMLRGVLEIPDHIDSYAGAGPAAHNSAMPPGQCPSTPGGSLNADCRKPSDAERTNLSMWIACERLRPHTF